MESSTTPRDRRISGIGGIGGDGPVLPGGYLGVLDWYTSNDGPLHTFQVSPVYHCPLSLANGGRIQTCHANGPTPIAFCDCRVLS